MPYKNQRGEVNLIIVTLVFFAIGTFLFGGLSIWAYSQKTKAETTVNDQVKQAVAKAKAEQRKADELEFDRQNQLPYRTYTARPEEGGFALQIPKSWSIYAERTTSGSVQMNLYASPDSVTFNKSTQPRTNIYPFKLELYREDIRGVTEELARDVKRGKIKTEETSVSGFKATKYRGMFEQDKTESVRIYVQVRDKTFVFYAEDLRYETEFNKIVGTAKINP